jgi:S-adenosyl-L-methionine hydrolase (adenosine-forming)
LLTDVSIFLASDYGRDDEFVGVLHAVLATLAPGITVVDLSHGIAPYDVSGGAALLARAAPFLGGGVVCAVVDPGVGGPRRGVALERDGDGPRHFVGPDNGLLMEAALALGGVARAVELPRAPASGARTFDGRDLFAPVAARLVVGSPLEEVGTPIELSTLIELPSTSAAYRELDDGRLAVTASVRWIDRYGNVQLSLPGSVLGAARTAGVVSRTDDALVRVVSTFSDLDHGTVGLLCDANGSVAIVVAEGSAARRFNVAVGDRVELVGDFGQVH